MYSIDACLVCGSAERTIVSKYNRFIFMESMWQSDLARFDYALCHGCGVVYATRRPDPDEYKFLYQNFNEFLMRGPKAKKFTELTPDGIQEMDAQFLPWWEVKVAPLAGTFHKALRTDLNNAIQLLPQIMPYAQFEGAKVLHIRAKGSTLGDMLRRLLGVAKTDIITLFPHYAYLAQKNEGIRAESCLNYEDFRIPFDEKYNLIIENHVFIHMLNPNSTFEVFASHLEPGGCIFFHNELNDETLFKRRRNLFAELRPFHYQQFDIPTIERLLGRYGFETVFTRNKEGNASTIFGLARLTGRPGSLSRIGPEELQARLAMYARWHDESILSLPRDRCRALFDDELDGVWNRVRATGALGAGAAAEPMALRRFPQMEVDDEDLEMGPEIKRRRLEREEQRRIETEARRVAKEAQREAARAAQDAKRTAKALRRAEKGQKRAAAAAPPAQIQPRFVKEAQAAQPGSHPANGRRNGSALGTRGGQLRLPGRLLRAARKMAGALGRR